ncbi:MAG: hypothetical protein WDO71_17000 [Bacteroidota bacterium]
MARFTTRIRLQEAEDSDYINLQTEIERESFRSIRKMPVKSNVHVNAKGEFNLEGNITIQEVTNVVVKAAAKTGKKYSFTIIRDKNLGGYER